MISSLIGYIDSFLNRITMYRAMLYYLILLVLVSGTLGTFGLLPYDLTNLLVSSAISLTVSYFSNKLFSKIFKTDTNFESVLITSLIIVLIMPVFFTKDWMLLSVASFIAMASKYLLALNKRHIFNPAAVSAVIMSVLFGYSASWWIGDVLMFPFIVIGGLLIIRKIQRERLFITFLALFFLVSFGWTVLSGGTLDSLLSIWKITLFQSPFPFFVFVMLIEPLTSPTRKTPQAIFAIVASLFYTLPQIGATRLPITPEMALIIGNAFSYIFYPNYRLILNFSEKLKLSKDTYSFIFSKQNNFKFLPGQYMEWTLPHRKVDSRGNRRYFTISSSPTEKELAITVKFYKNSSSYKSKLQNLNSKEKVIAAQVSGDFILPKNLKSPLVFIAGGVGITPFRSMIKYIVDMNLTADIVLIYSNRTEDEILFKDLFKNAERNGVKTKYILTDKENLPKDWNGLVGHIEQDTIKKVIPDYKNRTFYISGPQMMVINFKNILVSLKVPRTKIKIDFFPGYLEK